MTSKAGTTFHHDVQRWRAGVFAALERCSPDALCELCGAAEPQAAAYKVGDIACCPSHTFAGLPGLAESAAEVARRHCRLIGNVSQYDSRAAYEAGFTDLARWHRASRHKRSNYNALMRELIRNDSLDRYMADAIRDRIDMLIQMVVLD